MGGQLNDGDEFGGGGAAQVGIAGDEVEVGGVLEQGVEADDLKAMSAGDLADLDAHSRVRVRYRGSE